MRFIACLFTASAVLLSGCGATSTHCARPLVPALPPEAAQPCPPLPPIVDPSMGALAIADGEAVAAYAECQRRHAAVVAAHEASRATINGEN